MAFTIADILNQWQTAGVFDYILPFLLIFSVVFGILASTNILGKQKGVNVIVSLVVGLLALRLGFVQLFFAQIFPRLGVGIGVILALLILTGLFVNKKEARYWMWGIAGVAVLIWLFVLVNSFQSVGWLGIYGGYVGDYAGLIIGLVLLIGVIIAVVASKSGGSSDGSFERQEYHAGKSD
ncbi:hypothetical protein J4229_01915 [Candidatus Pacearchaeota archaeon]|nr:hypothetical protein [Candidatus Pacearchaeota archaeon]